MGEQPIGGGAAHRQEVMAQVGSLLRFSVETRLLAPWLALCQWPQRAGGSLRRWTGPWRPHPPGGHMVRALRLHCLNPSLASESRARGRGTGTRAATLALPLGPRTRSVCPPSRPTRLRSYPLESLPSQPRLCSRRGPALGSPPPTPPRKNKRKNASFAVFVWKRGICDKCPVPCGL